MFKEILKGPFSVVLLALFGTIIGVVITLL